MSRIVAFPATPRERQGLILESRDGPAPGDTWRIMLARMRLFQPPREPISAARVLP